MSGTRLLTQRTRPWATSGIVSDRNEQLSLLFQESSTPLNGVICRCCGWCWGDWGDSPTFRFQLRGLAYAFLGHTGVSGTGVPEEAPGLRLPHTRHAQNEVEHAALPVPRPARPAPGPTSLRQGRHQPKVVF